LIYNTANDGDRCTPAIQLKYRNRIVDGSFSLSGVPGQGLLPFSPTVTNGSLYKALQATLSRGLSKGSWNKLGEKKQERQPPLQ
jgi:hypothetical protein